MAGGVRGRHGPDRGPVRTGRTPTSGLAVGARLLSDLPRKDCWTIAERAGESTPDGMQHLLGRAEWDADQVRDDVRAYVVMHLRDNQAVLVVDETGDVKKGTPTPSVPGASTPAPRAGSRTRGSPSIPSTPAAADTLR
ncbi:transposase [Streptomyces sp. NPDC001787]|uniref:transposase n=1 Tax=Streptomyces sp. NPDC001787 TaxID=3154523 RepID=UPI00331919FA